jgi:hypothetical protein
MLASPSFITISRIDNHRIALLAAEDISRFASQGMVDCAYRADFADRWLYLYISDISFL